MAGTDNLERAIDELYVGPPEGFTESRNSLAKRLKDGGDANSAARVRGLRKPVRAAWAVNQLVSQNRAAVKELIAAGGRLRTAQRRAMSTKGGEGLRERSVERARLVSELTRRAAEALGAEPPAAVIEEIASTLEAASADEEAARVVLEARLSKPLSRPAGFGEILGLKVVPDSGSKEPPRERTTRAADTPALRGAERRERQARDRVERLKAEVAALKKRVDEREDHYERRRPRRAAPPPNSSGCAVDLAIARPVSVFVLPGGYTLGVATASAEQHVVPPPSQS